MPFDYKSVAKSRKARQQILRLFDWVPDCVMVPVQYRIKTGRWPNLKNPQRFTEKLQWLKLNYRDPLMRQCADKVSARSYVESCGYEDILVPLLGVYDSPQEIDFDALPERFVLKDSLGGGGNEVIICRDKAKLDIAETILTANNWLTSKKSEVHPGREWVYDYRTGSKLLVEQYLLPDDRNVGMVEFKFFCSFGKPSYLYVLANRNLGVSVELGIYKAAPFEQIDAWRTDERHLNHPVQEPRYYGEMLRAASILSEPFPEARIDFYYLGEKSGFKFSEITFFDGSGYFCFSPDSFDFDLGSRIEIPCKGGFLC